MSNAISKLLICSGIALGGGRSLFPLFSRSRDSFGVVEDKEYLIKIKTGNWPKEPVDITDVQEQEWMKIETTPCSINIRIPVKKNANGPCMVCGKPNVAMGRLHGIYLCQEHFEQTIEKRVNQLSTTP